MKQLWNIVDRGGRHDDPVNGPPGAWVHRPENQVRRTRRRAHA